MAYFARRRLQAMLDDLSEFIDSSKRSDLAKRLNNKRVEQAIPAQMELAFTWLLRGLQEFEIEPPWWPGGRQPDIHVLGLIPNRYSVIEVTTVSDNSMSGEDEMDLVSRKIVDLANSIKRDSGYHLFFSFSESAKIEKGKYVRSILADRSYQPSEDTRRKMANWLHSPTLENESLKIKEDGTCVLISYHAKNLQRFSNIHTSRPPRTYSDQKNPIYEALNKKLEQVEGAPQDTWRVILLADGGSDVLSQVAKRGLDLRSPSHSTAESIIRRFLSDKAGRVDAVVVLVPVAFFGGIEEDRWEFRVFGEKCPENVALAEKLDDLMTGLPPPHNNGRNARTLARNNAISPKSRGQYLGTSMTQFRNKVTYRMSSRALQDFLAKRIDEQQFRSRLDDYVFSSDFLDEGYLLKGIRIVHGGIDEGDDELVFDFEKDASVKPFE